jgi:hypothetical protein
VILEFLHAGIQELFKNVITSLYDMAKDCMVLSPNAVFCDVCTSNLDSRRIKVDKG